MKVTLTFSQIQSKSNSLNTIYGYIIFYIAISDFYILKVHSRELFLFFIENLFLIFWSNYSPFSIFSSENRPFEQQKTEARAPVSHICFVRFSIPLHFIPLKISSAISTPICACCSGVKAWPVSSSVVRRASFRRFTAFCEAVSGTI